MKPLRGKSGATEGRKIFWRWRVGPIEISSDMIARDYMRRWRLRTPWFMLRLHHILRSDSRDHFHDHPMDFASLILRGGYVEYRPGRDPQICRPGTVVVRQAEDLHFLELIGRSAWTFVVASPYRRHWGFQTEDGWIVAGDYDAWKARRASKNGEASQ